MKLNNKGFALTSIIYMLIVLFLLLLLLLLANLASRKVVLDKVKYDVKNKLDQGGINASNQTLYDILLTYYYSDQNLGKNGKQTNPGKELSVVNEGLIMSKDDSGNTYYFRGNVDNNYVFFAGKLFRVIRVNGDGTIRLILNGGIGETSFNEISEEEKYTGYTFDKDIIETNSKVKEYLEHWYNGTDEFIGMSDPLVNYDSYIASTNYCNDTSQYVTNEVIGEGIYYSALKRLNPTNKEEIYPIFNCQPTTKNYGGNYNNKIGLITADEIAFAGGIYGGETSNNYLTDTESYLTMTPYKFQDGGQDLAQKILNCYSNASTGLEICESIKDRNLNFDMNKDGVVDASDASTALGTEKTTFNYILSKGNIIEAKTDEVYKIRPVINLKKSVVVLNGEGTVNNPYLISTEK